MQFCATIKIYFLHCIHVLLLLSMQKIVRDVSICTSHKNNQFLKISSAFPWIFRLNRIIILMMEVSTVALPWCMCYFDLCLLLYVPFHPFHAFLPSFLPPFCPLMRHIKRPQPDCVLTASPLTSSQAILTGRRASFHEALKETASQWIHSGGWPAHSARFTEHTRNTPSER